MKLLITTVLAALTLILLPAVAEAQCGSCSYGGGYSRGGYGYYGGGYRREYSGRRYRGSNYGIGHRWSMRREGGPWRRGSIPYGSVRCTDWGGQTRCCRGGSLDRGIDRHCWIQ